MWRIPGIYFTLVPDYLESCITVHNIELIIHRAQARLQETQATEYGRVPGEGAGLSQGEGFKM